MTCVVRFAKCEDRPSTPQVALVYGWPLLGGVLIHTMDAQTHVVPALIGTEPAQAVARHQAPDNSMDECTKCPCRCGIKIEISQASMKRKEAHSPLELRMSKLHNVMME